MYLVSMALAYAATPFLLLVGFPALVVAAIWLTFPVAAWQAWRITRGDWDDPLRWNRIEFFSIALLIAAAVLELAAFVALTI